MLRNLWYGFRTVLTMKQKTRFIIYTVLLWTCYYLQLYFCIFAFSDTAHLGALAALSLFVMGSIGMGIPVQAVSARGIWRSWRRWLFTGKPIRMWPDHLLLLHMARRWSLSSCWVYIRSFLYFLRKKRRRSINNIYIYTS